MIKWQLFKRHPRKSKPAIVSTNVVKREILISEEIYGTHAALDSEKSTPDERKITTFLKTVMKYAALGTVVSAIVAVATFVFVAFPTNYRSRESTNMPYFNISGTRYASPTVRVLPDVFSEAYSFLPQKEANTTNSPALELRNVGNGHAYDVVVEWDMEPFIEKYIDHIDKSPYLSGEAIFIVNSINERDDILQKTEYHLRRTDKWPDSKTTVKKNLMALEYTFKKPFS